MSLDGIAALQAKREKATRSARHVPPARHAARSAPVTDASRGGASTDLQTSSTASTDKRTSSSRSRSEGQTARSVKAPAPVHGPVPSPEPAPAAPSPAPLVRATVYLQDGDDLWLERIAGEGRLQRPRVDASRSAVTRLALERLREQMTGDEIVAHLAAKAQASTQAVGRKRL